MSRFKAGLIGIIAIVLFTYLGFTKFANPFASPFTVHATFASSNGLRPGSLVRIAGVNVGKVTGISIAPGCRSGGSQSCQAADVAMEIDNDGLPLHRDATFWIRPRTFLEGNFFVDVAPGSPSAPTVGSGYTFPVQQGVEPVQLDQVLGALQQNTRQNLQTLLAQYGLAVKRSGPAYNASIKYWKPAYEYSSVVSHDFLGIQPHDLSNYIAQMATVSGALDTNPPALESLITDFNTTAGAFARQSANLQSAVGELPKALAAATPAFNALNAAIPPLDRLAHALIPGVVSAGPAIDKSLPFVTQLRLLVQPSELRGLTHDLSPTIPALAKLTNETIPLMKNGVRPAASCIANIVLPWSHLTINDSNFNASNGFPPREAYIEAVDFLPGLAGESRDFDANGPYIRVLGNGGTFTYSLQPGLFGQALTPISSVEPKPPPGEQRPPYEPTVPCETQAPITTLDTTAGVPIGSEKTNLNAPGAALRAQSALGTLADQARQDLSQEGLKTTVSKLLPSLSSLKLLNKLP
ncbi:MAG TPA: MlaD family protein [Solirubrobacteraceae bacterium]|nr:MlaD family protein [Solirubrobacteraceae bacterium]